MIDLVLPNNPMPSLSLSDYLTPGLPSIATDQSHCHRLDRQTTFLRKCSDILIYLDYFLIAVAVNSTVIYIIIIVYTVTNLLVAVSQDVCLEK